VRRLVSVALAAVFAAGCGGHGSRLPASLARLYGYDRSTPLGFRDYGVVNHGYPVKIHDVSYASPGDGKVPGFLLVPPGKGPFPAVVLMHGSGGTRVDFLVPAAHFARRGFVALTVTSPFDRPPYPNPPNTLAGMRANERNWAQAIVELRRALDLLAARRDVDGRRLGFVGFSLGAEEGAVLAGVDDRLRAVALLSCGGTLRFVPPLSASLRRRAAPLLAKMEPKDLIRYARAPLLIEDGRFDKVIVRPRLESLIRAAPAPRTVRWYDTGHAVFPTAQKETFAWLAARLRP
jgi:dienelactone hydrolase